MMLQTSLNHILGNARRVEGKEVELYFASKMVESQKGGSEMLKWAATYTESEPLKAGLGTGRSGARSFAGHGEYADSVMRSSSPPRKFRAGSEGFKHDLLSGMPH
jgi:hypothetical protein